MNSSSQANFYKPNSSKIKLTNVYPYDSFRPGGINELVNKGKSSLSPNKMLSQKEFFNKTRRNNSHQNNLNSYNIHYKFSDMDKLVEEVKNFKMDMNRKNKEIHSLKIVFAKLDEENKKNIHIIEQVIIEANKHKKNICEGFKFDPEDLENEIRNCLAYSVTSDKLLAKLLESHAINNLKRQIFEYKNVLANKEEELANFKANSRITKFQEVEGKLKNTIQELIHLKENYSMLLNLFNEKDSRFREVTEEKETYKSQNQKLKFQNEEFKERLLGFQDANSKMTEQIKLLEEKNSSFKYQISTYKTQLKEKENEILKLKSDISLLESYKKEKDKHEKTLKNLNSNITNLKEDLERKSNKLRELQRMNSDLKQKIDNSESKKNNDVNSRNKDNKSNIAGNKEFEETNEFNKIKKIKSLEDENVQLRKEIIKLNDDLINKADNQYANMGKEFINKNTNDNLQSEINHLILENKKADISQFEKNLEKELLTQDDLESENKFSDILKPLNIMENKDKASHRSFSSKHRLQAEIKTNRNNNNPHKNNDNQRYYQQPEEENENEDLKNIFGKNKIIKNNEILKQSINNSLNKEENNFNYSDFKNKNDFEDEFANFSKGFQKEEKLERIKRPENKKRNVSADNKEKLKQMLIEEENRNLNSSTENNLENDKSENNDFDACDEYLKEHEDLDKSDNDDDKIYNIDKIDRVIENYQFDQNEKNEKFEEFENDKSEKVFPKSPPETNNLEDLGENYDKNDAFEGYEKDINDVGNNNDGNYENEEDNYGDFA